MPSIQAVGYLRRSTDKQEASIAEQTKAVQKYADDHGYQILRWYTDDAISGDDTAKRKDFLRMIADAGTLRDFEAILCWDDARFGRFDSIEAGYYIYPLRKAGVYLATVMEGKTDWNDSTGRIVSNVKQEGKHQQLIDLSANVTRGIMTVMQDGSWVGSSPYGYRIEGKKYHKRLVLGDTDKVRIVQRIFREFVDLGRSMNAIAIKLNEEGFMSPGGRGKPWRFDTVKVILENPTYTGDYAAGRNSFGKYHTVRNGAVVKAKGRCRKPEAEWIVHRDRHEPIIDRLTFEKAQEILAKGKTGRNRYTPETNPFLLSGLLRCGRCGCPLWGFTNGKYRTYECSQMKYSGEAACEGTTIREDRILRYIADYLSSEFLSLDGEALAWKAERKELTPADLPRAFAKVKKLVSPPQQPVGDRKRMEKQSKALAAQIDKARRNLVHLDPEFIPTAQEEIRRLQAERDQLELELRKRPPSEADVNAEVMAVLRSLYWLGIFFRLSADPPDIEKESQETGRGSSLTGDFSPVLKGYLRSLSGITVHTSKEGKGHGTRHVFERGEIAFRGVGGVTSNPKVTRSDPFSPELVLAFAPGPRPTKDRPRRHRKVHGEDGPGA